MGLAAAALVASFVPGFVLGLLARTRWLALVPPFAWSAYFLGLHAGWWLHGVGDGWERIFVALSVVGIVGALLGAEVGRSLPASRARLATHR